MSVFPMEELLLDDPLASTGPDVEKNTINQGEMVATRAVPPHVTNEDDQEAIMVDEEPNKCYTCHRWMVNGSPGAALVVHVQQNKASKLTLKVCHACCRSLDYDLTTGDIHQELNGCPILPESKIIVNDSNLSHKCFRCFSPLLSPSLHPVSLQDGILNTSHTAVVQDSGYEFAVYLCNSCAEWKKFSGKMKEVTTLKFPAFDLTKRTLFLPPISNIQPSNSSQAGTRSITYPVSMLVNKAKSLIERFKEEASLSSPPTNITGCMMYIHTTKSSPSTHWSCDGFAFHKSSTRVVRIQNSDHVIRETNWVTAGPGDSGTRFKRRTITSSQLEDITLVHYLGEVCTGVQASREVDLEEEQLNISTHVSPQSCNKQTLAKKEDKMKPKTTRPLFSNYPASNIKDTPATPESHPDTVPAPVIPDSPSNFSTDNAVSEDHSLPTILSVTGNVGGITVMGSSQPLPLMEGPILHSQIAAQYSTNLINKSIKKIISPARSHKTLNVSIPGQGDLRPVLPTEPLPFNPGQQALRPFQLTPQSSVNPFNQVAPTPNPVLLTKPPQVNSAQSFQGLASKIVVSGNKIIVPHNFMASGARLVQVPSGDGTKRLVLINTSQVVTTSKNTSTKTVSVVPSIPANTSSSQVVTTSINKVTKTIGVVPIIPANTPKVVTTSKNTTTKTINVITSIPAIPKKEKPSINLLPRSSLDTLSSKNVPEEEPEAAVDPLESDSSRNPPENTSANQKSISQTRMNHLERLSAVQVNICAEIAEECIFNKNFSDVLIYGATTSEQKNPLRTHSLILSAISPNLRQLLEISERNGDGVYELVIPDVGLQEIEALVEEVIGTMLIPPKDNKSVTFTMSENLWTLFAGVRPEETKLGKRYIHNKSVVPKSFSARLKPMESLIGHWAKQSVCDEQTGQMVIEMGKKRKMVTREDRSMAKNIKTSPDISSGGIKLSHWSKQVGLSGQSNIQEKEPCVNTTMHSDNLLERYYNIYRDKLPVKTVSVNIRNLPHSDSNAVVYLDNYKKPKSDDKVLPPCDRAEDEDLDLLTNEDIAMVPPVKIRTSSNITGSMVKKKSPEKWIVSQ